MPEKRLFVLACVILVLIMGVSVGFSYTSVSPQNVSQDQILLAQSKQAAGGKTDQAEMHNQEGLQAFSAGKYDEAIRHYNQAIKIDSNNVKAYNNRGVAHSKMGKLDLAISDYTSALKLNPRFSEAYQNRALSYFRTKDYAQSCADLRQFRQLGGTPSPEFVKDLESASGMGKC